VESTNAQTFAHGKILWIGGYSVLERPNVSYVATVDAKVSAEIETFSDSSVKIDTPLGSASGKVDLNTKDLTINTPPELKLVTTSLRIALKYVSALGNGISGLSLRTANDDAMEYRLGEGGKKVSKSGLGSSAAVTVATIGAVLHVFHADPSENEALHKLSQLAHSVATGKVGSGFDIAAAAYGDVIYSRYSPELLKSFPQDFSGDDVLAVVRKKWDYTIEPLSLPKTFDFIVANFKNNAAITTSMVGEVNKFKAAQPEKYREITSAIDNENKIAIGALRAIADTPELKSILRHDGVNSELQHNLDIFKSSFNKGRLLTKKLGELSGAQIEPDAATRLIEKSVEKGAFVVKLPGAGGYDSIGALLLNGYGSSARESVSSFWTGNESLHLMNLRRSSSGFSIKIKTPVK
jgi:ERG8-type phosphomevalonate kinase